MLSIGDCVWIAVFLDSCLFGKVFLLPYKKRISIKYFIQQTKKKVTSPLESRKYGTKAFTKALFSCGKLIAARMMYNISLPVLAPINADFSHEKKRPKNVFVNVLFFFVFSCLGNRKCFALQFWCEFFSLSITFFLFGVGKQFLGCKSTWPMVFQKCVRNFCRTPKTPPKSF